jgi:electron transfer flavoprotein beta subunit
MVKIAVCVKVVADPEAPSSTFSIDPSGKRVLPARGVPPVLNPYDENALEAALKIKELTGAEITIISAGQNIPKAIIKKALAVGADKLIVIEDTSLGETDSSATAAVLAAAIRKAGEFDLVLNGRMASDTNGGQVGTLVAALLDIPAITVARKIEVKNGRALVERALADGYETVDAPLPCLITVSHESGELRQANVKGMMAAQKQPLTTWKLNDLAVEMPAGRQRPLKLFMPERKVQCEMVTADTPEEAGVNLAVKLLANREKG